MRATSVASLALAGIIGSGGSLSCTPRASVSKSNEDVSGIGTGAAAPGTLQPGALQPGPISTTGSSSNAVTPGDCHLNEELDARFGAREEATTLAAPFRAKLLPADEAARRTRSLTDEIVSMVMGRRFGELARLVDPERGLCLRPAKGAECRRLSIAELTRCGTSNVKERWNVDTGADEGPLLTCAQAFTSIFFPRDFRRPDVVTFNCFPPVGRVNNSDVILQTPAAVYVELRMNELEGSHGGAEERFRALWLVFDGAPEALKLVEMTAEYPGP